MENEKEEEMSALDFTGVFSPEVMQWLAGGGEKPQDIRKLDDVFPKLNMFLVLNQLKQFQRLPNLYAVQQRLEEKLYSKDSIDALITKDEGIISTYNDVKREIKNIAEQSRRFIVQNKDISQNDDSLLDRALYEKIRSMSAEQLKDYLEFVSIVERKGTQVLKDFIKANRD